MARPRRRRATVTGRPPVRAENRFAAEMAQIDAFTLRFLRAKVIPRLRDGARRREIEPLLRELDALLAANFGAAKIEKAARTAAAATNLASQRSTFAAITKATGLAVVGSDTAAAGAGAALGSTRAGRRVLVARRNVSIDLAVDGFVDDGVRLISTLRKGIAEGVGDAVVRAYTFGPDGGDPAALAERLLASWERKGVPAKIPTRRLNKRGETVFVNARSHAELIARDQLQKLHGKIEEGRQRAAGVERYKWRTQKDDRVRPEHRAREGVTFEWSQPPPDGHPGEPIMCRCYAEAVIEGGAVLSSEGFVSVELDRPFSERGTGEGLQLLNPGPGALGQF